MCARVCILKQGQILALNTPERLKASIGYDFRLDMYQNQATLTQKKEFDSLIPDLIDIARSKLKKFELNPSIITDQNKLSLLVQTSESQEVKDLIIIIIDNFPDI